MRRFGLILLTLVFLPTLLWGCGEDPSGALHFQDAECHFTASCDLTTDYGGAGDETLSQATTSTPESYVVEVLYRPDHSGEVTFLSPESLKGCKYLRTAGGEYSFQAADLVFPVEKNPTTEAIFSLFFLSEDDLLSAKLTQNSGEGLNVLTFKEKESGQAVTLYLNRDGMPLRYEHPLITLTVHAS